MEKKEKKKKWICGIKGREKKEGKKKERKKKKNGIRKKRTTLSKHDS